MYLVVLYFFVEVGDMIVLCWEKRQKPFVKHLVVRHSLQNASVAV